MGKIGKVMDNDNAAINHKKKEEYQIILNINTNPDANKTAPITNTDNINTVSRLPKSEIPNNESKKANTKKKPTK